MPSVPSSQRCHRNACARARRRTPAPRRPDAPRRAAREPPAAASRCRARSARDQRHEQESARARARRQPCGRPELPPQRGHENGERPREQPVVELHRRHVAEEILPPRLDHEDLRRNHVAVHQRERVVGEAGADAGDEAAGQRHDEDQRGDAPSAHRRAARCAAAGARARRGYSSDSADPQHRGEDDERQPEMRGQPELRHARIVDQAALHHVPAHRALQPAEHEDAGELPRVAGRRCCAARRTRAAAAGSRRRSARPSSRWKYSHQKMPLNSASAHALVDLLVLRRRAGIWRTPPAIARRSAAAACRRSAATR